MINYLLGAISCLCLLYAGVCAEECEKALQAQRNTLHVPAGGDLSLSCVVRHCGATWKADWICNTTHFFTVKESARHHLTQVNLSANKTQLILNIWSVDQSDEGTYGCTVKWGEGDTDQGHLTLLNITAAVPSQRNVWHRVLVCAGASLCLPIILGLARCLSSKVKPQPLPRTLLSHAAVNRDQPHPVPQLPPRCPVPQKRSTFPHKVEKKRAPPKFQQKPEVLYADISQGALRQQGSTREPAPATVYSSLRFTSGGGGRLSAED